MSPSGCPRHLIQVQVTRKSGLCVPKGTHLWYPSWLETDTANILPFWHRWLMFSALLYSQTRKSGRARSNGSPCKCLHEYLISLLWAVSPASIQLQIFNQEEKRPLTHCLPPKGPWGWEAESTVLHLSHPHLPQPPAAQLQHQPEHHHHNAYSYKKPWQSWVLLLFSHRRLQSHFPAHHSYSPKPQTKQLMSSSSINHQFYHHKGKNSKKIPSKQPHTIKRKKKKPKPPTTSGLLPATWVSFQALQRWQMSPIQGKTHRYPKLRPLQIGEP